MEKATTLKEIAIELGLSVNTVSRALRNCDDIGKKTKKLVIDTAIKLGYLPNSVAQFVKSEDSPLIVIIVGDISNLYYTINAKKISLIVSQNGYTSTILYTNSDIVTDTIIKQCISQRVDGIITLVNFDKESLKLCELHKIPLVAMGINEMQNLTDLVHYDIDTATNIWANYIINFHKSEKIVYIGLKGNYESKMRLESFKNNLHKISSFRENSISVFNVHDHDLVDLFTELDGNLAVCCFSDEVAYSVLNELNTIVPNVRKSYPHFHIISFDSLCTHYEGLIDISSIDHDYDLAALEAFNILIDRKNNPDKPFVTKKLPVSLHTRKII